MSEQTTNPIRDAIAEAIADNEVILFMKGNPDQPACGFSARTVAALQTLGAPFAAVDILPDPRIRQELSALSNWPTIPQLFVKGELVGGCDIVTEMYESGELARGARRRGAGDAGARPRRPARPGRAAGHREPPRLARRLAVPRLGRVARSVRFGRWQCAGRGSGIEDFVTRARFWAGYTALCAENPAHNERGGQKGQTPMSPSPSMTASHAKPATQKRTEGTVPSVRASPSGGRARRSARFR